MLVLHKVTVFVDGAGNAYRKATASEAVANDSMARGIVNDRAGFYLPTDLAEVVAAAKAAASAKNEE